MTSPDQRPSERPNERRRAPDRSAVSRRAGDERQEMTADVARAASDSTTANGELHCEGVALAELAARFGTPLYVYSRAAITAAYMALRRRAERSRVAGLLRDEGEFQPCRARTYSRGSARASTSSPAVNWRGCWRPAERVGKVVFSGVGKSEVEIEQALARRHPVLQRRVRGRTGAHRCRRSPPGTTCPHIAARQSRTSTPAPIPTFPPASRTTSSAWAYDETLALYRDAARRPGLEVVGIDCHIGSQITEMAPYLDAADRVLDLVEALERGRHRAAPHRLRRRSRHPLSAGVTASERRVGPGTAGAARCARLRSQDRDGRTRSIDWSAMPACW